MDDDSIREALVRRRPVPRGDSWCWIPKPYDSVFRGGVRDARRWRRRVRVVIGGVASRRFFGGLFSPPRRVWRENVRFDGESRVEGRASIDRSIDRSRSVGRGVAWVTGGGARFGRRRDARRRWGCLFEFRSDGRAGVGVARRVESSRWMGRTRTRTHRERAATRGVDLARRRSGSRERFD